MTFISVSEKGGVYRRNFTMRADDLSENTLRLLASTPGPVNMGGWREILVHSDECIEREAATALLLNHDVHQIIGAIRSLVVDEDGLRADVELIDGARDRNGSLIRDLIAMGALRGVSIGYTYRREDTEYDRDAKVVTVNRWRLLEITLTPIPADASAGVRSLPVGEINEPDPPAKKESDMSDEHMQDEPIQPGPEKADREAILAETREIVSYGTSHGLPADDLIGRSMVEVKDLVIEHQRLELERAHSAPQQRPVAVIADAGDKQIDMLADNFSRYSTEDILRRCANIDGMDCRDLSVSDLAQRTLVRHSYVRDAANKTSSSFSVLTGNVSNKQLLGGFDRYVPVWPEFCTIKDAVNFNQHPHVGVSTGRLTETDESVAFPELTQKEGTYNSTLAMWGATVSVTYQALINDQLGEIMSSFMRAGYAAARTIERQVFSQLLNATWTNDVTASAGLGTAGHLDKTRAGLKGKLNPAGEKMENDGKILIVDPANRVNAETATGILYSVGTGGTSQQGSNATRSYTVVDSSYVSDTSLLAGVLNTNYYLVCDPMVVDTVVVEFLRGQRAPQIQEFDAGAVAASKYKIMLPFAATVATHTDSAGNARVTGIQKATA